MLGFYTMEQVCNREVRVVNETVQMVKKNASWIEKTETKDEDLRRLRKDERLDALRDPFYPDTVLAGVMHGSIIHEITVRLTGIHGPFVVGEVDEEPSQEIGLHFTDKVWAIPYYTDDEAHLIILFGGETLSEEESEVLEKIVNETGKLGIDFSGISMKS